MNSDRRLSDIRHNLETGLDGEEEYLEEGAMGTEWPKSWVANAASQLQSLFKASEPTAEEIACCVEAIADPERIRNGRSKQLLLYLREHSHPILEALANSTDPQLRIFALETANSSTNSTYFAPLYGIVNLRRLLNDPDENIRIAVILTSRQTLTRDALFIRMCHQKRTQEGWLDFFDQLLARLSDPSAKVRTAAAGALRAWATHVGHQTLSTLSSYVDRDAWNVLLEYENDVEARKELERASMLCNHRNSKLNWR